MIRYKIVNNYMNTNNLRKNTIIILSLLVLFAVPTAVHACHDGWVCPPPEPPIFIMCFNAYDCGTNGPTGSLFCQGNNVYQNYITYTCNNPGTASSTCTNATNA
ncbi:MAG: hypothetical protein NTY04_00850, partial [Candidatus Staskawiczbacteria bacterium]|nr:hypothetical protein [Candidatus Staskawiczbacteria bacterium]